MIVITGGAGFVGSQIIHGLNAMGRTDILVVDDLTDGRKFRNLLGAQYDDYWDYEDFLVQIKSDQAFPKSLDVIFHQGACTKTYEWNGRYLMRNNYEYAKSLLNYCSRHQIQFIYASSASVYGTSREFTEADHVGHPLNMYAYSKWMLDQNILKQLQNNTAQIVGLRYFNIYGPHEAHKEQMASVAYHFMNQLRDTGVVRLFGGYDGYMGGEQARDFIAVSDVVKVNLWFMERPQLSGIFNVGTGVARTFNELAHILIDAYGGGEIEYIPFPEHLKQAYQSYTQADISQLRGVGYDADFLSLQQGLDDYLDYFNAIDIASQNSRHP